VVCDFCGHHYLGRPQNRESITIIRALRIYGKDAILAMDLCSIKINLKKAVLARIQEEILSEENVRKYINLVLEGSAVQN
jgi:hypothetical protein